MSKNLLFSILAVIGLCILSAELTIRLSLPVLSGNASRIAGIAPAEDRSRKTPNLKDGEKPKLVEAFGRLPLQFEANEGRTDASVKFISRGQGYGLFLTSDEAVLQLEKNVRRLSASTVSERQPDSQTSADKLSLSEPRAVASGSSDKLKPVGNVLRMKIVGGNRQATAKALDQSSSKTNYFIGNDPAKWRTNVSTYGRVEYKQIYPGIDLVYYGNQRQLEYDFRVAAGADPKRIKLSFKGARHMRIDERGDLILHTKAGDVRLHKPNIYQEQNEERREVSGSFVLNSRHEVSFDLGDYDRTKSLVIDPSISYSNTFGGTSNDDANGIAVDSSGNAYVVGTTFSTNFPVVGGVQSTYNGGLDVFVTKVSPTGTLVYSTYLGGTLDDQGRAIAVDSSGAAYVTGSTRSTNFPTASPLQAANAGGFTDAFVTKLNPAGSALVYSTYIGGTDQESGNGIAVDSGGNAYVTGYTQSSTFPTKSGSFQTTFGGGTCFTNRPCGDAFVFKLNPTGSAFVYSTFLGGNSNENLDFAGASHGAIAIDNNGNAYVTGVTGSTNFPTANPFQSACNTCSSFFGDAFVTKLNAAGTALIYSSFLGGSGTEVGRAIAVNSAGEAFVTGNTGSGDFPTTSGAYQGTSNTGFETFVTKVAANGSSLNYSTFLGGSGDDFANGIAVDSSGNAYVIGTTVSTDFPTANPIQAKGGGSLFKTTNGASSWTVINSNLPSTSYAIAIDPTNSNVLYDANAFGLSKSTDGGATWNATGFYNQFSVFSVALDPTTPSTIYGGLANGVIKSIDGGSTWTTTTTGFTNAGVANTFVIDPTNPATVYVATTNAGILKSTNAGGSWTPMNNGITSNFINTLVIDRTTPATLYAGNSQGVLKTTNGGTNWLVSSTGLPASSGRFVDGIAFSPTASSILYATTAAVSNAQGGVFKSIDGGSNWTTLLRTDFTMGAILVDRNNANTIYAATSANSILGLPSPNSGVGILKSTDGGVNWSSSGLTQDAVQTLIFDPISSSTIYAPVNGGVDGFIAVLDASGSGLGYASYLGGTGAEQVNAIALDASTRIFLAGATASSDFPTPSQGSQSPFSSASSFGGTITIQQPDSSFVTVVNPKSTADLAITKEAKSYSATDGVKFRVTVTNNGPDPATDIYMTDDLGQFPTAGSATPDDPSLGGCGVVQYAGMPSPPPNDLTLLPPAIPTDTPLFRLSCAVSSLAVGKSASFTVTLRASLSPGQSLTNTANVHTANTNEQDPNLLNNSATATFTRPPRPTVTNFSPVSGPPGTNVVISGANFTGTTSVGFNGKLSNFTTLSDSEIDTTVPSGATTGPITIDGPGGSFTTSSNFTVTAPCPTITLVDDSGSGPSKSLNEGTAVQFELAALGGTPPYKFTLASGSLPPGLFVGSSQTTHGQGSIKGRVESTGTYTFTVRAQDANGCTGDKTYVITVTNSANPVGFVTNTNNSGAGSLSQALTDAMTHPGTYILFNIPGTGPFTISPTTTLLVPDQTTIGADSELDAQGLPQVIVDGANAGLSSSGFSLGNNSTISGLEIRNFTGPAVQISGKNDTVSGNTLHDNLSAVLIANISSMGNKISQDSIYNDSCDAINLGSQCVSPNPEQQCGGASGPNNLINTPVIDDCTIANGTTTCHVREDVPAGTVCNLELFENDTCGASGYGEGKNYLGNVTCTADNSCEARCTFTTTLLQPGQYCTATATDASNNTSEFSACKSVVQSGTASNECDFNSGSCSVDQGGGPCVAQGNIANLESVNPNAGTGIVTLTVNRTGNLSAAASVDYQTIDGTATQKKNYTIGFGTLSFAVGESSKSITILLTNENLLEGNKNFYIVLLNPKGITLGDPSSIRITIVDKDTAPPTTNLIDQSRLFVQQHYYDFLSRFPDQGGWDFWTNNIDNCTPKPACADAQRINTSAAYFLSIEFQQTGYLVERLYKTAYGDATGNSTFNGAHTLPVPAVRFLEFMPDTQKIGQGVVVGQGDWQTTLENNKQAFTSAFVQRARFTTALPTTMTPAQFVDKLNQNAGNVLSASDRAAIIALFGSATNTSNLTARAQALRQVAESQALQTNEFNRAFVLMQFFGYLRRDPNASPDSDYSGFDFWLTKLNQFNGNYINAEMVKAFITSSEYRQRFGP